MKKIILTLFLLLFLTSCTSENTPGNQSGAPTTDAPVEAATNAVTEAPAETATDAGTEAPAEATTDAVTDAGTEASVEADTDAGTDAPAGATPTPAPAEFSSGPVTLAESSVGDLKITPLRYNSEGVSPETSFLIQPQAKIPYEELLTRLTLSGADALPAEFSLSEDNGEGFTLTPSEALKGNTVYAIKYSPQGKSPLSFAFQTEAGFGVTSTTPGKDSYSVPVDSGIEITFSEGLAGDIEDYFSISPRVTGEWKQTGDTHTFIPDSRLDSGISYTVTVKGGAGGITDTRGRTMEEDYTFTFMTDWQNEDRAFSEIYGGAYGTFLPGDPIYADLSVSREFSDADYTVTVYRVPNAERFLNGPQEYRDGIPADYEMLGSLVTQLAETYESAYQYRYVLPISETLPEGYYLADISASYGNTAVQLQKWIQVSKLSVYSISAGGGLILWVNDTETGIPVEGASVRVGGIYSGEGYETDRDGIAVLSPVAAEDYASVYITDDNGTLPFAYSIKTFDAKTVTPDNRYLSYLYTDRYDYLPSDTVRVFGTINARSPEFLLASGDKITLAFGDMWEVPVTLDGYGCFEASADLKDMYGYVTLELRVNGEGITSRGVNFSEYERDKYILETETDRRVYFAGEAVTVTLSAATFDGAPAEGLTIDGRGADGLVTDEYGLATDVFTAEPWSYDGYSDWNPNHQDSWYTLMSAEEYIQDAYVSFTVLPSDVMLEYEQPSEGIIEFTANSIDRDALEDSMSTGEADRYLYGSEFLDIFRGSPVDIEVKLTVYKNEMVPSQTGEYYDFIEKRNISRYSYKDVESFHSERTLSTQNGRITADGLPVSESAFERYRVNVQYTDTHGRQVGFDIYTGYLNYYRDEGEANKRYQFYLAERPETPEDKETYKYNLRINETGRVRLTLQDNTEEIIEEGAVILVPVTNNLNQPVTGSPAGTDFKFLPEYAYNVLVTGAYFDGKRVYRISNPLYLNHDYSEKELSFEIDFDKQEYAPGEAVNASVKVTDKNSGEPVQAEVNVSVVDEAVLAQNPNEAYYLSSYYSSAYHTPYPYEEYSSYTPSGGEGNYAGGAEMGNGGYENYNIRKDFNDNPAFLTVETDAGGGAEVSFKLSDAVTSWRVTLHGITRDGKVGNVKRNIVSALPFYLDVIAVDTFLTGDEVAALAKPHGGQFKRNTTPVAFTAELLSGGEVVSALEQESAVQGMFNFGKQPAGEYTLRVYAALDGGEYRDAMEEKIRVAESDTALPLVAQYEINDGNPVFDANFNITASPVEVLFTNGDVAPLSRILWSCFDSDSRRTDYIAAEAFISNFWSGEPVQMTAADVPELRNTFSNHYGMPELLYGEDDLLYTARFFSAFPELLTNKTNRVSYAREYLAVEPEEPEQYARRAAAYYLLAVMKEPVLTDIYREVEMMRGDGDQTQFTDTYCGQLRVLTYAAALCALGDDTSAAELMAAYPTSEFAYGYHLSSGDGSDADRNFETLEALRLYALSAFDQPAAFETLKTKTENQYVSDVCEKINFIRKAVPASGRVSEMEYTLDGETKKVTLVNFDCHRLSVTVEQYDKLNARQVSGNTDIRVNFTGTPENLDPSRKTIGLTKKITPVDGEENLYRITLTVSDNNEENLPRFYNLYDRVPSNMRYTSPPGNYEPTGRYYAAAEGQRVSIWAYKEGKLPTYTIDYYAIRVSDAEAVTPPAYIGSAGRTQERWGMSE
ncbi:MAG: Ig-like domain-containing protein [Clostridiales bacterium]|nr:Ig-like domain-containing protein [Clostridiales bacterium]